MTNNNPPKKSETRSESVQNQLTLDELWYYSANERKKIFMSIKNKSEIPSGFELVGNIAEPIEKKSKQFDRANSHWEVWRDKSNKSILIFRVDNDIYELLAMRDMEHTHMYELTEISKATMKLFRMFK